MYGAVTRALDGEKITIYRRSDRARKGKAFNYINRKDARKITLLPPERVNKQNNTMLDTGVFLY